MSYLLTQKKEEKQALRYLAFDGRKDKTLMSKNQMIREEHMTFSILFHTFPCPNKIAQNAKCIVPKWEKCMEKRLSG